MTDKTKNQSMGTPKIKRGDLRKRVSEAVLKERSDSNLNSQSNSKGIINHLQANIFSIKFSQV